jgi:Family of unknown function (DUF5681)
MADHDDPYEVGYSKPPRQTRFTKGQSGNPKGRPKGSQNLASIVAKAGRERVKVTGSNGTRSITKVEAAFIQLANQAASGDLRAIREFTYLLKSLEDSGQSSLTLPVPHERDRAVMANIVKRIQQSQDSGSDDAAKPGAEAPSGRTE